MKLVSMAQKPAEAKEEKAELAAEAKQPMYPYGTCVRLNEEAIEKLGWKELPKVGTSFNFAAKGVVKTVSNMEGMEHSMMEVELQLTDIGVELGKKSDADTFYPSGAYTETKKG